VIAFLRGRVAGRGPGWAELDVGGIGFRLALSAHAGSALPPPGAEATVPTALVVREDGVALYGFRDEAERAAFLALTAVATVGPKTALAVLSVLTPEQLAAAVEAEDAEALVRVPGIGRKTAQRLILELKGRLQAAPAAPPRGAADPAAAAEAEARAALVALGYSPAEAAAAVEAVRGRATDAGELVRAALREKGLSAARG
jgi:Holliday junction DNA helicase RuvA